MELRYSTYFSIFHYIANLGMGILKFPAVPQGGGMQKSTRTENGKPNCLAWLATVSITGTPWPRNCWGDAKAPTLLETPF